MSNMTATELRLDNLIFNHKGEVVKFDGDFYHWIDGGYNPIPLTEEWLLKFGFEKVAPQTYLFDTWYVDVVNGDISFYLDGDACVSYVYLEHVHQLQNLFYSLTGQELNTKK